MEDVPLPGSTFSSLRKQVISHWAGDSWFPHSSRASKCGDSHILNVASIVLRGAIPVMDNSPHPIFVVAEAHVSHTIAIIPLNKR